MYLLIIGAICLIIGVICLIISLILDVRVRKTKKEYIEKSLQEKRKHSVVGERISVEVPESISSVTNIALFRVFGFVLFFLGLSINSMAVFNMISESILL